MLILAVLLALSRCFADDPASAETSAPVEEPTAPVAAPAPVATPAPAPVAVAPKAKPDRGGHVGIGVQFLNPGRLSLEGNVRFGRIAGRIAAGVIPYVLLDEADNEILVNPGDLRVALAPRLYFNKSMTGRYQHAIEGLLSYSLFSLDTTHPKTAQQVGVAVNYAGELYLGRRLAFSFGGGPGVLISGNPSASRDRFALCQSAYVDCGTQSSVVPWLDMSVGFRLYFL